MTMKSTVSFFPKKTIELSTKDILTEENQEG
jgi:hypothetical protein